MLEVLKSYEDKNQELEYQLKDALDTIKEISSEYEYKIAENDKNVILFQLFCIKLHLETRICYNE